VGRVVQAAVGLLLIGSAIWLFLLEGNGLVQDVAALAIAALGVDVTLRGRRSWLARIGPLP
jgi:hypothetical protein